MSARIVTMTLLAATALAVALPAVKAHGANGGASEFPEAKSRFDVTETRGNMQR